MADADLTITISGKDINASATINKLMKALDALEKDAKDASKQVAKANNEMKVSFERSGAAIQRFTGEASRMLRPLSSMAGKMMAIFGATGLVGAIYKSISAATSFQDSMQEISTLLSGPALKSLDQYADGLKKLSRDSGKSTQELSKGLYQVISAGTKGTEDAAGAMDLLNVAQKAATAGVSNTFAAVDALTTVLNSYNVTTKEAEKFSDILFTTVRMGKTTFNELAAKIGVVASTAAGAGIPFEELNAAIAQLTKGGLSTDMAMTSLNATIVQLVKPSKELESAVLGLNKGYTSVGDMLSKEGLGGAMRILNQLTGGSTEKITKLVPAIESLKAISILAGTGMDGFNQTLKEFQKTTGATEEAYKKMTETFTFKLQQFRNKTELAFLEIGQKLMPQVTSMLDGISSWFDKNADKIVKNVKDFSETLIKVLKFLVENADTIIKVMAGIWLTEKLFAVAEGIAKITLAIKGLNAAMMVAGGKIGLILGAIAVVGGTISERGGMISDTSLTPGQLGGGEGTAEADWAARQSEAQSFIGGDWRSAMRRAQGKKSGGNARLEQMKKEEEVRSKMTEKEIKEWKKAREGALKYLHDLEVNTMSARQKLEDKFEQERQQLKKQGGLTAKERVEALGRLEQKQAEELAKFEFEAADERRSLAFAAAEAERKEKEKTAKLIADQETKLIEESHRLLSEIEREKQAQPGFWEEVAIGFARRIGEKLYDWALNIASAITSPLTDLLGGFQQVLAAPFSQISNIFNSILGGAGTVDVQAATEGAVKFFEALANELPKALAWFAEEGAPRIIQSFVKSLPTVIRALCDAIPKILDEIISNLDKIIMPFVEGILTLIPALIERVPDLIQAVVELAPQVIFAIIAKIPEVVAALGSALLKILPSTFSGVISGLESLFKKWDPEEKKASAAANVVEKELKKLGYTEEQIEAVTGAVKTKMKGEDYDPMAMAKAAYDIAYAKEFAKTQDPAAAQKAGEAAFKKVIDEAVEAGLDIPIGAQPAGNYSGVPPGPPAEPRNVPWADLSQEQQAALSAQWQGLSMDAYNQAYQDVLTKTLGGWKDQLTLLKLRGFSDEELASAEEQFKKDAESAARSAAENAYMDTLAKLRSDYDLNSAGASDLSMGGGGDTGQRYHLGGMIKSISKFAKVLRAHSGAMLSSGLASDEVPIIAQTGEAVMNRRWVQGVGGPGAVDAMNRSGGMGGVVNNVYVEHMMSGDTAQVIDRMIGGNLRSGAGRLYSKMNAGSTVGYKTRRAS